MPFELIIYHLFSNGESLTGANNVYGDNDGENADPDLMPYCTYAAFITNTAGRIMTNYCTRP